MSENKVNILNPPALDILSATRLEQLSEVVRGLILSDGDVKKIREILIAEMELGLNPEPSKKSSLQMANTFVTEFPDGSEEGEFLALDLGGTNFRIILLELNRGRQVKEIVKFFHVPDNLRTGHGIDLFDYLASCIHQFLEDHDRLNKQINMGFTFSFPMEQKGLDSGILVAWTKSFNCAGTVGEDAVKMLNNAIKKYPDVLTTVIAILNDTTGTLIQGSYLDKSTGIGLILGTGSNACYIENVDRLTWDGPKPESGTDVIVDIEWGAFGDTGVLDFIKTDFDREVDNNSLLVNSFMFEKYIAGKYLGELCRCVIVKLYKEKLLFTGDISPALLKPASFTTRFVSFIEEDSINNSVENTKAILEELELDFDMEDVAIVKYVCYLASNRAAKLVSICLAYLLDRMNRDNLVTIAVDGSLYQFHPRFKALMAFYIHEFAPSRKFGLLMAEDGSGKGAGMLTAIAQRQR